MHTRILLLLVFVFQSAAALAVPSCGDAPSHASERACWTKAANDSAARVKAEQAKQRQRIEHWGQDPPERARSLALFNKAASQFVRFRQAQCDYEASAAAGGNGAGDMNLSCQVALDESYLKSLHEQARWFSPGG
jgi:hypothetical protein